VTVHPEESLLSLLSRFIGHPGSTVFVATDEGHLQGIVTVEQVRPIMRDPAALEGLVIAEDVMVPGDFPTVTPADSLADVMKLLSDYRGEIPVVDAGGLAGVIWPEDVIARYNAEVFKRDMAGSMATTVGNEAKVEKVPGADNTVVGEIPVPAWFVGKSIRELQVRQQYGVSVLMVKHVRPDGTERLSATGADYVFRDGDTILALGAPERLRVLGGGG